MKRAWEEQKSRIWNLMVEDQSYDRWGRALNPTFLIVRFEHGTTVEHKGYF